MPAHHQKAKQRTFHSHLILVLEQCTLTETSLRAKAASTLLLAIKARPAHVWASQVGVAIAI